MDCFILAAQEKIGVTPNPEANRAVLIRRLTFLHNGRNFRLTDVSGQVINHVIA